MGERVGAESTHIWHGLPGKTLCLSEPQVNGITIAPPAPVSRWNWVGTDAHMPGTPTTASTLCRCRLPKHGHYSYYRPPTGKTALAHRLLVTWSW